MGRLSSVLGVLGIVLLLPRSAAFAGGGGPCSSLPVINGKVTSSEWEALPYNQALLRCTSVDCVALKSIVRSFDYFYKLYLPGTVEKGQPAPSPPSGPAPLVRDVALHPELRAPSCELLRVMASNYFDWSAGLLTVELASLISRGHRCCLTATINALPQTKETRHLVHDAQQLCVVRHEPNCSAISFR